LQQTEPKQVLVWTIAIKLGMIKARTNLKENKNGDTASATKSDTTGPENFPRHNPNPRLAAYH
jgi:hypothetical protein